MIQKRGSSVLHFFDRYAGIPAVALLMLARRKRAMPFPIKTLGLLRTAAIGDTVLMSAAIADLRAAFPGASVIFFAGPTNFEIAGMLAGVDHVVELPVLNPVKAVRRVRSVPVDVMLDFGQWPRLDALLACLSGSSFTIGFRTPGQHRHYGYDAAVAHSRAVHEIENFRNLVRALGVETGHAPRLKAPFPSGPTPIPYAVFHLWPGGRRKKRKEWPKENWLALIEEMAGREMEVVLTGSVADRSANDAMIERASPLVSRFVRNAAGVNLRRAASLLAQARLVVSVDTGVMHMAAALGAPVVALHGPTSSRRWGPISEKSFALDSPLSGSGYLHLGWEDLRRPLPCMEAIPYEAVLDACRTILARQIEPIAVL